MYVRRALGLGQGLAPGVTNPYTSLVTEAQSANTDFPSDLYENIQYGQIPKLSTQTTGTPTPAAPFTALQLSGDPSLWTPQQAAAIGATAYSKAISDYASSQESSGNYNPEGNLPGLITWTNFMGDSTLGISNLLWVAIGLAGVGLLILWKK